LRRLTTASAQVLRLSERFFNDICDTDIFVQDCTRVVMHLSWKCLGLSSGLGSDGTGSVLTSLASAADVLLRLRNDVVASMV